ncbi:glycosyltransferase family 4 protein [Flavobacterium sp.]|uniref:glycosyltransferase family 4 protein n=1 Tax=Flavobacterium sp. TaxID=239 RepID=UPI002B4B7994|nr:glycosyltransferase family 4 protein [Flavobacterium sp.]HLP65547.1 glycosyltransferase family 4 protein [Flavobacterium sp.]
MSKNTLIRITTVPLSLDKLLEGQLNYMGEFYNVIAVSSEKEYLEAIGKRENVATHHIEMTRKITPLHDLVSVVKMYFFFKKVKPFIVHTHTPKAGIVGMVAARFARVPHRLHTVAGLPLLEATGLKRKLLDFVEKLTYSCATKVYPNSNALLGIIQENNYCPSTKLKVIGKGSSNGINTDYFDDKHFSVEQKSELKKQLNIHEDDFVFIFVGRIVADKGINELISAFSELQQQKVKLLLVGPLEQDLNPLLPETLQQIQGNANIISVGYQNDVRPYFAISNALVFPSYREGFPNVVMQAGAMNLPSIVTNINGCNEIIEEGKNGIIIPVKNSDELHKAMLKFVANAEQLQTYKQNSRELIVSRYQQSKVWNDILEEYRNFEQ